MGGLVALKLIASFSIRYGDNYRGMWSIDAISGQINDMIHE
jgi:hypothetical protein